MYTVKFIQDTEIKGVGTLTAFNSDFSYPKRVNTNIQKEIDDFVLEAKEKFNSLTKKQTEVSPIESSISALLNK